MKIRSLGTEDTVAGVAETGDNVAVLVEACIDAADDERDIGMLTVQT